MPRPRLSALPAEDSQPLPSPATPLTCLICGHQFGVLAGHVRITHGVTITEYEARFPGAPAHPRDLRNDYETEPRHGR